MDLGAIERLLDSKAIRWIDVRPQVFTRLSKQLYIVVGHLGFQLAAGVTPDTLGKVKAGELVNFVAQQVGGKGGGKPDMAMAGGTEPTKLDGALASVLAWVSPKL